MIPSTIALAAQAHASAPVIDIDGTIVLQAAIFLILFLILRKLVFAPYMEAHRARSEHVAKAQREAEQMKTETEEKLSLLNSRVEDARRSGAAARTAQRRTSEETAREILADARSRAETLIETTKAEVERSVPATALALRARADQLAAAIANKVLGRPV